MDPIPNVTAQIASSPNVTLEAAYRPSVATEAAFLPNVTAEATCLLNVTTQIAYAQKSTHRIRTIETLLQSRHLLDYIIYYIPGIKYDSSSTEIFYKRNAVLF